MEVRNAFSRMDQYFGEEVKIPFTPTFSLVGWKVSKNLVVTYFDVGRQFHLQAYTGRGIQFGNNAEAVTLIKAPLGDTFEFIQRVTRIVKEVEGEEIKFTSIE